MVCDCLQYDLLRLCGPDCSRHAGAYLRGIALPGGRGRVALTSPRSGRSTTRCTTDSRNMPSSRVSFTSCGPRSLRRESAHLGQSTTTPSPPRAPRPNRLCGAEWTPLPVRSTASAAVLIATCQHRTPGYRRSVTPPRPDAAYRAVSQPTGDGGRSCQGRNYSDENVTKPRHITPAYRILPFYFPPVSTPYVTRTTPVRATATSMSCSHHDAGPQPIPDVGETHASPRPIVSRFGTLCVN